MDAGRHRWTPADTPPTPFEMLRAQWNDPKPNDKTRQARAGWAASMVSRLSHHLTAEVGDGASEKS